MLRWTKASCSVLGDKRLPVATGNLVNRRRQQRQGALIHRGEGLATEQHILAGTDKPAAVFNEIKAVPMMRAAFTMT